MDETKSYKEPVTVIKLRDKHHALDLWESVCKTEKDLLKQAPILLLPEGYEFADSQHEQLMEMGRIYKANELVNTLQSSMTPLHNNVTFQSWAVHQSCMSVWQSGNTLLLP